MSVDYQRDRDNFEWNIPEGYNIPSVVESHAKEFGQRVAVRFLSESGSHETRTYNEIRDQMNRFANGLEEFGIGEGDRVMHLFPRHPDAFAVQLGILATGSLVVPCSSMLRANDIEFRANDCEATAIVVHESLTEMVEPVVDDTPLETVIVLDGGDDSLTFQDVTDDQSADYDGPELRASMPVSINYTSGTTGKPKPVLHKHRWLHCFSRINAPYWWGVDEETDLEDELLWATTGTGWAKWFWSPVGVGITMGATQLIYDGEFDPETFLEIMEEEGVTKLCAVPTQYRMFANEADLSEYDLAVNDLLSAGEPLNVEPIEQMREHVGVAPRDGYGQTETVALVTNYPGIETKPGSMGKPTPGVGATLLDLDDEEEIEEAGEIGEIAVPIDSPAIFDGYFEKPHLDERKLSGEYYRTGDLARVDEDGFFFFEGRADDVIISSGYRIGPFEVEDALVSHEAVAEAAVVESPHDERGAVVKAYIVLSTEFEGSEALTETLQEHAKNETAPYKYPRRIEYVEELPKTSSGKIQRVKLREREQQQFGE
ncbi:acyl-CoA synthetase [Halovenus salina]|uniref:acyl-CoA synthetase n=1 Tax=Halovenus salina TaxID=1510225 RepID=UPI002260B668|nr:AMP-binding protein [Halovenus salina]